MDALNLNLMIGIITYEKRFWTEIICQSRISIGYFPMGGEKGGLRKIIFNYNKNLKLFDNKSLFYELILNFVKI